MDESLSHSDAPGDCGATPAARDWRGLFSAWLWCERAALQYPLRFSLLAVLLLMSLSVAALHISYETNDDVFLTMIASGRGFCPAPDEHLIFSNILIGRVLKSLYQAAPGVPWYGSYLLLVHYLAQVALLYVALAAEPAASDHQKPLAARRASLRRRMLVFLVVFAVVELVLLNNFQFTTTAFLAGQAGIFLLWLAARIPAESSGKLSALLAAGMALIVLAGLIRVESLYMALLMSVPPGIWLAAQRPARALLPSAAAAVVALTLVVAAGRYNRAQYEADPAWSRFYAFNALRCRFNDYGWTSYTPQTEHAFSEVGWSKDDHDMIARWFFDDPVKYSETNLRSVLAAYPWKTARWSPSYLVQAFRRPLQDRSVWAVWLALPFLAAGIDRKSHARVVLMGCAIVGFGLLVAVSLNNKIPPLRLYFPLLAFPLSATLLFPAALSWNALGDRRSGLLRTAWDAWKLQRPLTQAVVVMLIVGATMGVYRQARRTVRVERNRVALASFLSDAQASSHKLYVCWEAALPFELLSPLDNLADWSDFAVLTLTWTQRTPWQDEIKRRFGISGLAQAICERDDIVLVATPEHRELFVAYAQRHHRAELEYLAQQDFGDRSSAGRFQQVQATAEMATRPADSRSR